MTARLLVVLALAVCLGAPAAAGAAGRDGTRAALAREMAAAGHASGAYVVDLDTGSRLYARRPARARVPASVSKLFTTATVLLRFGPRARLTTSVLADAPVDADGVLRGNLYLRGAGDPALTTAKLRKAAAALAAEAGVLGVAGRVIADESAFDARRGPPSSGYAVSSYVGPLGALSIDRGRTGRSRPYWQPNPPLFAARSFARALKTSGVRARVKAARVGVTPPDAVELWSIGSPTMAELVRRTNVRSDNFAAEQLLKATGFAHGARGSTAAGAVVVRSTLRPFGVRPHVVDGSGLSRSNAVSPRHVVGLLQRIRDTPAGRAFEASLATAGRSGTLRRRMRRSIARDRCTGKTGTLSSVSALAGYCLTRGGSRVAYAILQNGVDPFHAKEREDRMLAALAAYDG